MNKKIKVGLIGCGTISGHYIKGCKRYEILEIVACADIDASRAQAKAAEYGIPRACSVDELLANTEIEIVINLTIPQAHTEINERVLRAGKHVYVEKPVASTSAEGKRILALARSRELRVACAPDTFLGGGIQTCRKLIDDGAIGQPVAALAFFMTRGPESFHPTPEFLYQPGGGPMFDMGPYYLTIMSPARLGQKFKVATATHLAGVMDFAGGASATIVTSFDVWNYPLPQIVVFGTESTLEVPDPNWFVGPVRLRAKDGKSYEDVALTHTDDRARGTGVADLAYAIRSGRPHRAQGDMGNHVLEVIEAFGKSSVAGQHVTIASTCARPEPLPLGLAPNVLDS
jgi:predicted dehydrogenase